MATSMIRKGAIVATSGIQPIVAKPLNVQTVNGQRQPTNVAQVSAVISRIGLQPIASYTKAKGVPQV